jgi:hypothetical protein
MLALARSHNVAHNALSPEALPAVIPPVYATLSGLTAGAPAHTQVAGPTGPYDVLRNKVLA